MPWLLKSWTRYCLVDRSSLAGDVKPAPWDFNLHSWCVQTTEEEKVPKENILQKMLLESFPTFPPLFATFMLTAWVSLIQTTQAINTPIPLPLHVHWGLSTLQSTTSPTAPPISGLFDPQHWHLRSLAQTILKSLFEKSNNRCWGRSKILKSWFKNLIIWEK